MQPDADDEPTSGTAESGRGQDPRRPVTTGEVPLRGFRRIGSLLLAGTFFVLGALGAILPILPATPFLLLTSYFLVRSSPRLNAALLRSRFFGPILNDWQTQRVVRKDIKFKAILIVVVTVGSSLYLTAASLVPALCAVTLSLVGIVVVLRLPEPGE